MAVATGQSFGNFQVVRLLGEGGFGEVYEAQNPFLQRRAAVKVLHAALLQDPELVRRFLNEARAASAIRHPNIIEVYDAGVTPDGEPYILMEFLDGDSLQKLLLQQGRMPLRTVQEIVRQAGSALSAAHTNGIVHRDLKPENIFLVPDAQSPIGFTVKVLDFGIAKVRSRDDKGSTVKTQAGLLMGSPAYMSPEQCRDSSDVDHRTDIYSLAVIVYEMLAGVPPFASNSATEMLVLQMTADPAPLREHVPDLPEYAEQAVARAMTKDREQRYANVDYFVGALLGTYPALTAQGSPTMTDPGAGRSSGLSPYPTAVLGRPSVARVDGHPSRMGVTPAPMPSPSPTITTLSRAAGDASSSEELAAMKPRRWPLFVAVGAVAAALAVFFALRLGNIAVEPPKAQPIARTVESPKTVSIAIRTTPAGASVFDEKDGNALGMTPFEKSYPQAERTLGFVLRLAGYKDKNVTLELDGNSSTDVELERVAPPAVPETPKSPPAPNERPKKTAVKKNKPATNEEDEWRVH